MTARPKNTWTIGCPGCGQPVNSHDTYGYFGVARYAPDLPNRCRWTPNDIAWYLLFGELTPAGSVASLEPGDV